MTPDGGPASPRPVHPLFEGAGELRDAYAAVDWSASPLGPPQEWSPALRTALQLAFATSFPVTLLWGQQFVLLYNSAYTELVAGKHPQALGRPCEEVFPEIWDQIGPLMQGVLDGRGTVRMVDQELRLVRRGFAEECYFTYAYSPVDGADGRTEGVLDLTIETTHAVVDARRARLLGRLADLPSRLVAPEDLADLALPVLGTDPDDLPEVELLVPGRSDPGALPPVPAPRLQELVVVGAAGDRTAWLRLPGAGSASSRPLLRVRLSPSIPEDDRYLGFLRQVAAALGNALAVASAVRSAAARADLQAAQVQRLVGLVGALQELLGAHGPQQVEEVAQRGAAQLLGAHRALLQLTGDGSRPRDARGSESAAEPPAGPGELALEVGDRLLGRLSLGWDSGRTPDDLTEEERAVLSVLASSTAQALDRSAARAAEQRATEAVRAIAEELQRSLLTEPPAVPGLQVAVRYSPAAEHAQVGGDWYDAFATETGALQLVVGDVTGHDQRAAAAMSQLRNTLRGIAHSGRATPAQVLQELDGALPRLGVTSLATAVLGTLAAPGADGSRELAWSSAGHLPPLLLGAGGPPRLLEEPAELLLGLFPGAPRTTHTTRLPRGATVLLYTDGLVERRGSDLQTGLDWLVGAAAGLEAAGCDELCDGLLDLVGGRVDDDIALVAVRVV